MTRPSHPVAGRSAQVRNILASAGLNFMAAYRASRRSDPKMFLYPLPHNLESALNKPRFRPSAYQLATLSRLTRYRLVDWLDFFGFSFDEVVYFQTLFRAKRTVELDARTYRRRSSVAWFEESREPDLVAPLTPLATWLGLTNHRTLDILRVGLNTFDRFVRIGSEDAFAFPDLIPGSIVRIRPRPKSKGNLTAAESRSGIFLIEHSQGLVCTRVAESANGKLVLCSRQMPYAPVELQQGTEAIVRGKADLELRLIGGAENPVVPLRLGRFWTPRALDRAPTPNLGVFIRQARLRSGLRFREASARTRKIALVLKDPRYYCAPSTLSDFEARKTLPRQIHKIISVCSVYFLRAAQLLDIAGIPLGTPGHRPIPEKVLPERGNKGHDLQRSTFFEVMERRFGRIPYFLSSSLSTLCRLPNLSPRDVFWAGGSRAPGSSLPDGSLFLVLDRRQKTPRPSFSSLASEQPLYVVVLRDGTYRCGFCALQNGFLILRPFQKGQPRFLRLENRVAAEVVGRVVALLRKLR